MAWRLAKSLEKLRDQVNAQYPNRSKTSDGSIGDAAHSSRDSDHNVDPAGVVAALDLTHHPQCGFDSWQLGELLRLSKDPRIKYVISAGRIFSSTTSPWVWRKYSGANSHHHHIHVSTNRHNYDDTRDWQIDWSKLEVSSAGDVLVERPLLRRGSKGAEVRIVQQKLGVAVDGDFGARTEAAVRAFQTEEGLTPDGLCGVLTWGKLDELEKV